MTPITIQDHYEIFLETQYAADDSYSSNTQQYTVAQRTVHKVPENAPAPPVLFSVGIQRTVAPGSVVQGELQIRNLGDIPASNVELSMPSLSRWLSLEDSLPGAPDLQIQFLITDSAGQTVLAPNAVIRQLLPRESAVLRYQATIDEDVAFGEAFRESVTIQYDYLEHGEERSGRDSLPIYIRTPERNNTLIFDPFVIALVKSHEIGFENFGLSSSELPAVAVTNSSGSADSVAIGDPLGLLFSAGFGITDLIPIKTLWDSLGVSALMQIGDLLGVADAISGECVYPPGEDAILEPSESCTLSMNASGFSLGLNLDLVSATYGDILLPVTWNTPAGLQHEWAEIPISIVSVAYGEEFIEVVHTWQSPPLASTGEVAWVEDSVRRVAEFNPWGNLTPPLPPADVDQEPKQVTFDINQHATLDREAFSGTLRIDNGSQTHALEHLRVDIETVNAAGEIVSSDHRTNPDMFFSEPILATNLSGVDGDGWLAPLEDATSQWTIIPTPEAGGNTYWLRAHVSWEWNGVLQQRYSLPVKIDVAPQPFVELAYFIEPAFDAGKPFRVGVAATNTGKAAVHNVNLTSDQPEIDWQQSTIEIGRVDIVDAFMQDGDGGRRALADWNLPFGTLDVGQTAFGWWELAAWPGGNVDEFSASCYHDPALGGDQTSLLAVDSNTAFLLRYGIVNDAPGGTGGTLVLLDRNRDGEADSLLDLSSSEYLPVTIVSETATQSPTLDSPELHVSLESTEGWGYTQVGDPFWGQRDIAEIREIGGHVLDPRNYWIDDGLIHVVDYTTTNYVIVFEEAPVDTDLIRVIDATISFPNDADMDRDGFKSKLTLDWTVENLGPDREVYAQVRAHNALGTSFVLATTGRYEISNVDPLFQLRHIHVASEAMLSMNVYGISVRVYDAGTDQELASFTGLDNLQLLAVPLEPGGDGTQLPDGMWTVITHGLTRAEYSELAEDRSGANDKSSGWMRRMAERIAQQSPNVVVHMVDWSASSLDDVIMPGEIFDGGNWSGTLVQPDASGYHHLLLFDWTAVSDYDIESKWWHPGGLWKMLFNTNGPDEGASGDDGYAEGAADALYALAQYHEFPDKITTLIGFSRGAVVMSEMAQRLLINGYSAGDVIYLDAEGGGDSPDFSDPAHRALPRRQVLCMGRNGNFQLLLGFR